MKATYNTEPEAVLYMPLPDGRADVWLRKNIDQTTDEDGNVIWTADEVYFRTSLSKEQIEASYETLYENGGEPIKETETVPTMEERMDAVEAAILELAEVMTHG